MNPRGWMTIPARGPIYPIYPIYHVLTMAWVVQKCGMLNGTSTGEIDVLKHQNYIDISPLFGPYMCFFNLLNCHFPHQNLKAFGKARRNPFKTPRRAADVAKAQASNPISWQSWGSQGSQVVGFHSRIEVTNRLLTHRKSPFFLAYPIWKWANYGY